MSEELNLMSVLDDVLDESVETDDSSLWDRYLAQGREAAGQQTIEAAAATDAAFAMLMSLGHKYEASVDAAKVKAGTPPLAQRIAYQSGKKSDSDMGDVARASKALAEALVHSRRLIRFWHKADAEQKKAEKATPPQPGPWPVVAEEQTA